MKTISSLLIFILSTSICLCQETFPINIILRVSPHLTEKIPFLEQGKKTVYLIGKEGDGNTPRSDGYAEIQIIPKRVKQ